MIGRTTSSPTRRFSCAFTLRKASRSTERKGVSPGLESNLPGAPSLQPQIFRAGCEHWTLRCTKCGHVHEAQVHVDPMKSDAQGSLHALPE